MKPLYTASVTVEGGRDGGHARSSDSALDLRLALPEGLGGKDGAGATNPEQLFAAGYAACFQSALQAVAAQQGKAIERSSIAAQVHLGKQGDGFGLAVELAVSLEGVSAAEAADLVETVHAQVCPYSKAVRGNIDVAVTVV